MHHIILPIAKTVNKSILFRRFIDDIIWFSRSKELTDEVQEQLSKTFNDNGLKLLFRRVSTQEQGKELEFLDVNHRVCNKAIGGFYTTDYMKPTARERVFLNGSSHHPRSVFRSIVFSESTRMRRPNERDQDYELSIDRLEQKCLKSGFNKHLVTDMVKITRQWKERFSPPVTNNDRNVPRTVWPTQFPKLLKLSKKEKSLNPSATVTYKRPSTLSAQLTNYRRLSHDIPTEKGNGSSPCNHCKLCGLYGGKSMVTETTTILSELGKRHHILRTLTCKDFGIYAATCKICRSQYVGQTVVSFSDRWSQHRSIWKNGTTKKDDRAALRIHYTKHHPEAKNIDIADAFEVTFVDKPEDPKKLDILESSWIGRLCTSININKTPFPKYR